MNKQFDMAIIGGDRRQLYMADYFKNKGYRVVAYGLPDDSSHNSFVSVNSMKEALESSNYVIVPVPMSRGHNAITAMEVKATLPVDEFCDSLQPHHCIFGGCLTKEVKTICQERSISYYDFMEDSTVAYRNAIATAEGTIAEAILRSTGNLYHSKGLILGYGRCAKVLAHKLQALGMFVTIAARKEKDRTEANVFGYESVNITEMKEKIHEYNYIFNTIPDLVLTKDILENISIEAVIIDIASAPGGIDFEAAKELHLNAHLYLGIPGKVAPKASAEILAEAVLSIVKERSD